MMESLDKTVFIKPAEIKRFMCYANQKTHQHPIVLEAKAQSKQKRRFILKLINRITLIKLFTPMMAYAGHNGDTPVSNGLSYIIEALTGGTGIAIATIALMGVSIACLFHHLEWKALLYTVAGVAGVFGAGAVVEAIKALVK